MRQMILDLTTESPVLISQPGSDPNVVDTCTHITGSALAGACAAVMLANNGLTDDGSDMSSDPVFRRIFTEGRVSFGNAWPLYSNGRALPLPVSLVVQKGATAGAEARDWLCADAISVEPHVSAGQLGMLADGTWSSISIATALHFHHARDYERGVGLEGQIFNYEAIEPGQKFRSYVTGEDADLAVLATLLKSNRILRIGRSRNVEYGRVRVSVKDKREEYLGEISECGPRPGTNTLTLVSDLVLPPHVAPTAGEICAKLFGLKLDEKAQIPSAFVRIAEMWSFSGIRCLPTPSSTVVKAGSCFRVHLEASDVERCRQFQSIGAGRERWRGYGRFVFNWQMSDHLSAAKIQPDMPKKPEGSVPDAVTRVIESIVRERIVAAVRVKAIEAAKAFGKHMIPSRSLTGRLEQMVKTSESVKAFTDSLQKLRSIASANLEKCWNGQKDLLTWLKSLPDGVVELSEKNLDGSQYVSDLAPIKLQVSKQFRELCIRVYLESFFAVLRKMKGREK